VTAPAAIAPNKTAIVARIAWVALIVATLYVCYFSHLGAIGFVGPDEPRYAWIARDMAETGDWVTPRLYGQPWFEKPPLYYWGAAICFKLFGVSEAAARLPSAISALLATLAMAWLARRLYGAETARWLLLLLPTTVGMIGFSHAAATDMPFSAMLTIAMVCAAVVLGLATDGSCGPGAQRAATLQGESRVARGRWSALMLFGFFLGLAVLAKGPAGLILCGGAVFFWALFTKRWRDAVRLLHPTAIGALFVTALPWYILCARRNPDFFRIFIIEHNFKRYLTPEFQHIQPFWFYLPVILVALYPWVGMSVSGITYVFRRQLAMQLDNLTTYVICWTWFPVIFFSLSQSKLPGYVLPAIPGFVFLTVISLAKALGAERVPVPAGFAVLALTPVSALVVIGLFEYFQPISKMAEFRIYGRTCLLLGGIAIVTILGLSLRNKYSAAILTGLGAWVCLLILTYSSPLPSMDSWFSPRPIAFTILRDNETAAEVRTFHLQRGWQFALNFYLRRELQEWNPAEPLGYVLASPAGIQELRRTRIPYQVLDDTSLPAILIRIRASENKSKRATAPESSDRTPKVTWNLAVNASSRQPQ
jgi:4-amino-4-deoxy-L-arabinose transferase-like glycosyltransferase